MCVLNTVGTVHVVSVSVCLSVSLSDFCFILSMRRINVHMYKWTALVKSHFTVAMDDVK